MKQLSIFLALVLSAIPARPTEPAPRPNIVIIYADDVGYGDLGCYGGTQVPTPNIDHLASDGRRFTDAHAAAATCTPSRYSLLTGEYAFRNARAQILSADAPLLIKPGSRTLPEVLRKLGYATGCIGKWHVGLGSGTVDWNGIVAPGPLEVGFTESFIVPATPDRVPCVYLDGHRVYGLESRDPLAISYSQSIGDEPTGARHPELLRYPASRQHQGTIVDRISRIGWMAGGHRAWWQDEAMAETLTAGAVRFITEHRERPFFLYFAANDVHVPRAPAARFVGASRTGLRGDAVAELDWSVGEIMAALTRLRLTANTLVIFSSDNGPIVEDGYEDGSRVNGFRYKPAGPYRGGKYQVYEGGTRVPFITSWPGHVTAGVSPALVSQVDLAASLGALTGAAVGAGDSMNVLPALLGPSDRGRDEMVEEAEHTLAIRKGKWKYIPAGKRAMFEALAEGDATAMPPPTPDEQLYDLSTDPGEQHNLATVRRDVVAELAAGLARTEAGTMGVR